MALETNHRQKVVPARIRRARREMPWENGRRVSQETFAGKLGVHWVTVSSWERGKAEPETTNLIAISRETGRAIEWFYGDGDEEEEEAAMRRIASDLIVRGGSDDLASDLLNLVKRREVLA